jgi:hypothetical protein
MNLDSYTRAKRNTRHPKRLWYRPLGKLTSTSADEIAVELPGHLGNDMAANPGHAVLMAEVPRGCGPLDATLTM